MGWIALKMLVGDRPSSWDRPGPDVRGAPDHAARLDLLRADAPDMRADHRHHRRRPLGHGPHRPLHRRRQAHAREQPVSGPGRRGRPLGRPALQGSGPGEDQPARRPTGNQADRHRAGDPARAGRRDAGRVHRRPTRSWPATCATSACPTPSSSTATGCRSSTPTRNWDELKRLGKDFYRRFLGRQLEMNDHRAIIVGVCEATRTFQTNPVVYTTYSRAKNFAPQERKILSYILAKTEPGLTPEDRRRPDQRRPASAPRPATSSPG